MYFFNVLLLWPLPFATSFRENQMIKTESPAKTGKSLRYTMLASALAVGLAAASAHAARLNMATAMNVGPLNPHLYSPNQMFGQAMVYEPLVKYTEGGKLVPWLAESWQISADGKTYTFKLRKGVKFTDGQPFDAQAVKKNVDAIFANRKRHSWLELVNQIDKVDVIDTSTVSFVLKNQYYPFLQDMALVRPFRFISPASIPESGSTAESIKAPVGTGPWQVVELRKGEFDHFKRNDGYWGKKPVYDELMFKVLPDPNTRSLALESGQVDMFYGTGPLTPDAVQRFRTLSGRFTVAMSQPLVTRMVALNTKNFPTSDLAVRKAMEHAVNKDAIISSVLYNVERKADTLYASNVPYANVGLKPYAYNAAEAVRLLEAAGWKLEAGQKVRTKDGKPLEVDLCFIGSEGKDKAIAEVMQADMAKVGIKVNLVGEEQSANQARQRDGSFHMILNATWGPPYEPHSFAASMRKPAHADYQAQSGLPMKAEIDKRISDVLISTDNTKRASMWRWIITTLHDQAVYIPISYTSAIAVSNNKKVGKVSFGATETEIPFELMQPK